MTASASFAAGAFPIGLGYNKNNGLTLNSVTVTVTTGETGIYDGSNGCVLTSP